MSKEIKMIGEIDFLDIKVKVYHDPYHNGGPNAGGCVWQMRNPDTCYSGIVYMNNETREITYPEDAVVPVQTDRDREMLPKFIIVESQELDDDLIKSITTYLTLEYTIRNKKAKK